MTTADPKLVQQQLSNLFGTYRAEWLQEQVFELFTEPHYFPELATRRSCVLIGGRGTGKTTVLRGLSYEGQLALSRNQPAQAVKNLPYFGLYHRVNTNHVTAFCGPELDDRKWNSLFAHYFNVLLCDLLLEFITWFEKVSDSRIDLGEAACRRLSMALHLPTQATHGEIREALTDSRIEFEAYINNVIDAARPRLSLQQAPVDLLCTAILSCPEFKGKHFFFLIDEYENLLEYQQRIVNTFVKHTSGLYFFKLGVRELGWRCHSTLNENEQLVHPADYARVSIAEKLQGESFRRFALDVCSNRLSRLDVPGEALLKNVEDALPGLSNEDEALVLGVKDKIESFLNDVSARGSTTQQAAVARMHPLEIFFLQGWSNSQGKEPLMALDESIASPTSWKDRYENYKFATLFAIREGKRGIDKFYCGWDTFTLMAAGNVRYVLELVDQSFVMHLQSSEVLTRPISAELQTKAAQRVGVMNLSELEGLSVNGARLTKLLLSLGRIFQQLAAEPFGHAPEMTQFHLTDLTAEVEELLRAAVMHMALLRFAATKLGDDTDLKDNDYAIHPIFSALFEISPRRKRKMNLNSHQIINLIEHPKKTIEEVLKIHNRAGIQALPSQLSLFDRFYKNET